MLLPSLSILALKNLYQWICVEMNLVCCQTFSSILMKWIRKPPETLQGSAFPKAKASSWHWIAKKSHFQTTVIQKLQLNVFLTGWCYEMKKHPGFQSHSLEILRLHCRIRYSKSPPFWDGLMYILCWLECPDPATEMNRHGIQMWIWMKMHIEMLIHPQGYFWYWWRYASCSESSSATQLRRDDYSWTWAEIFNSVTMPISI